MLIAELKCYISFAWILHHFEWRSLLFKIGFYPFAFYFLPKSHNWHFLAPRIVPNNSVKLQPLYLQTDFQKVMIPKILIFLLFLSVDEIEQKFDVFWCELWLISFSFIINLSLHLCLHKQSEYACYFMEILFDLLNIVS